jgi:hypothetical protein
VDILKDGSHRAQILITTHSPDILNNKSVKDSEILVVDSHKGKTTIAPMDGKSRDMVRKHLYTPGELLRSGELKPDREKAKELEKQLNLFGPANHS